MNKILKIITITLLTAVTTLAQDWKPTTGSVKFNIKMLGVNVNGTLGGIKANLTFQNNEPVGVYASVNSNTVNTSNSLRDSHLKEKPEFFEPAKYPEIKMKSKSITKSGSGYEAVFDITLKNVTKSVKVPFTFKSSGDTGTFSGKFTLNRDDFNFGGSTVGMSDDVKVTILLNVKK